MEASHQLRVRGKSPLYPLHRRISESHNRFESCEEKKNPLSLPGIKSRFLCKLASMQIDQNPVY
jgi:hypothetical protein